MSALHSGPSHPDASSEAPATDGSIPAGDGVRAEPVAAQPGGGPRGQPRPPPTRLPPRLLNRPRLFDKLSAGVEGPATLVAASAGMGKTVLLASWIGQRALSGHVLWLTLDSTVDDPQRFWAALIGAARASGVLGDGPSSVQARIPRAKGALTSACTAYIKRLRAPLVLVLDDFHAVSHPEVLAAVQAVLRLGSPMLRLVIATRVDPTLPHLSRLRVGGDLVELRGDDLSFTDAETAELLDLHDVVLTDASRALLRSRTQGWAAGLRLAALWLQGRSDASQAVASFVGTDRTVADYLVAEVLDTLAPEMRDFLLSTCVVDQLNGELADALTGRMDGTERLVSLERSHTFLSAADTDRKWFRYHPLFAELLRFELRRRAPDRIAELHRRASHWLAEHERPVDAIRHAVEARDWSHSVNLLTSHGLALAVRGRMEAIRPLLDRLPDHLVEGDAELGLLLAIDQFDQLDREATHQPIAVAQREVSRASEPRRADLELLLGVLELLAARRDGDLDRVIALGQQLQHSRLRLPTWSGGTADRQVVRSLVLLSMGAAHLWSGHLDAAEEHLTEGTALATRVEADRLQLEGLSSLAQVHASRGRLGLALRLGTQATAIADANGWLADHRAFGAHVAQALVHLEHHDLDAADQAVDLADRACANMQWRTAKLGLAIVHSWVHQARGDAAGGHAVLDSARQELGDTPVPAWVLHWTTLTDAELHLASGELDAARRLLADLEREEPHRYGAASGPHAVSIARLLLADGEAADALQILAPWLQRAGASGSDRWLVAGWLLHAVASDRLGRGGQAARSLERALALAEAEGFRQVFLDSGRPTQRLLSAHVASPTRYRPFIQSLLDQGATSGRVPATSLIDPLTARQRDVLRYLPTQLSAEEIARELYLSIHTVKSHIRQIYRKLEVARRREAVERARELNLL